jgi:methyl-galactoside transport system substrate-binding protein
MKEKMMNNARSKRKMELAAVIGILAIAIVIAVFVFTRPIQSGQRFAIFLYDGNDTFIVELVGSISSAMPEDITYEIFDASGSQSVQNQQIVELIDRNFDLFIINAVDRLASSSIVERLSREGIPIIFFNREPLPEALVGNVFYVGAAADSLGERQAEIAAQYFLGSDSGYKKQVGDTVRVIILKGEHGHQDAERRTENSISRLQELGFAVDVLAIHSANWRRQDASEAMRALYAQFGDRIDLVFSNNDDMALGAIDFLLEEGIFVEGRQPKEQPFIIIGVDGTPVGLEAIYRGLLFGTVDNDNAAQSSAILTLADYIMNERDFSSFPYAITSGHFIYIDGGIITRENVIEYIRKLSREI